MCGLQEPGEALKSEHLQEGLQVTVLTVFETLLFFLKAATVFAGGSADSRAAPVQSLPVRQHNPRFRGCGGCEDSVMECKEFSTGNGSGFEIVSSAAAA